VKPGEQPVPLIPLIPAGVRVRPPVPDHRALAVGLRLVQREVRVAQQPVEVGAGPRPSATPALARACRRWPVTAYAASSTSGTDATTTPGRSGSTWTDTWVSTI
jgi:hypothetical protein